MKYFDSCPYCFETVGFDNKKEWYIVKCPYCGKIDFHTPKGLIFKNGRIIHKCKNKECEKQFILRNPENSLQICNKNTKKYKNATLFEILSEISPLGNHLKRLKKIHSSKTINKYSRFLLEKRIIVYDLYRIDEMTSHFKLNFKETNATYECVFSFFLPTIKNKNMKDRLNSLKNSDFRRLNLNFRFLYRKVKKGFLFELVKELPIISYNNDWKIERKIRYYIVKQLKDKKIFCRVRDNKITKEYNNAFKTERFNIECILYWLNKNKFLENIQEREIGNSYRLFKFIEVGGFDRGIHRFIIIIREFDICNYKWIYDVFRKLRDKYNLSRYCYSRYFNLSLNNSRNIRIDICDKYKNGLSNIELFNKGILELRLFLRENGFNEMEVELVNFLVNMNVKNVEYGLRITSPETLILNNFKTLPHTYKVIGGKYWIDYSDGFELDITGSFMMVFLYVYHLKYDFMTIYGKLFNQFIKSNKNLAIRIFI